MSAEDRERDLLKRLAEQEALNRRLERRLDRLIEQNRRLTERVEELTRRIAELARAAKRQATPFARRVLKAQRRKAGRPAGHPASWREVPTQVDEDTTVPLGACPCCGGAVSEVRDHEQYVLDLPEVRPHVRRIVTQSGFCDRCRKRVRSTHPEQVSTAGGAAKVALGVQALSFAADLKHRYGVPYRDIAELFAKYFHLPVTHGALAQASVRLGRRGFGTYAALALMVRQSPVVHVDDTGWRVDTDSAWLWVFATPTLTLYLIARSRGHDVVEAVLGADFQGTLVSDGLPALDSLKYRRAQCLGHLVRRAAELESTQDRGAVRFPRAVKGLLKEAIQLTKVRALLPPATQRRRVLEIEDRLDDALAGNITSSENKKLANHMRKHREQLLRCLKEPGIEPTNNLAERELRPAVILRKTNGCNRSDRGADAHAILASVAQTAHRNGMVLADFLRDWLHPRAGPSTGLRRKR